MSDSANESNQSSYLKEYADRKDAAITALKALMRDWQAKGYNTNIVFEFNGSGDSGEINPYDSRDRRTIDLILDGQPLPESVDHIDIDDESEDDEFEVDEEKESLLFDTIYTYMYELLTGTLPGWEINEGSSGYITLEFTNNDTQQIELNMRVIESHDYMF